MTVEWLSQNFLVRFEGNRGDIDALLRTAEKGEDLCDLADRADEYHVDTEVYPQ